MSILELSPTFNLSLGRKKESENLDNRPVETKNEAAPIATVVPVTPLPAQHVTVNVQVDMFQVLMMSIVAVLFMVAAAALVHELRA